MRSKWFELKETAVGLRKSGMSMTVIEQRLGIPRSTLSGWFRAVPLTDEQRLKLSKSRQDGWRKAREKAIESHRANKALRVFKAKKSAQETLENLELTAPVLDIAFAMLYMGEGSKTNGTSIANSNPIILKFVLAVLRINYNVTPDMIRCELHLRADQNADKLKLYWSQELGVPLERFGYVAFDKRSSGKATYAHYMGVCVVYCSDIAIQRKLVYLYNSFCEKVASLGQN